MSRPARRLPVQAALLAAVLAACGGEDPAADPAGEAGPPRIATTTAFLAEVTGELAGSGPVVRCIVPGDRDPVVWRPDRAAIAALQDHDLIVLNGAGLEGWSDTVALPRSRVVVAGRPLREVLLVREAFTHTHGTTGEHTHRGVDPYVWLDPTQARTMVATVAAALARRWPERTAGIAGREEALAAALGELDATLRAIEVPEGEVVHTAHRSYDYLARRCGWRTRDLDFDPAAPADDDALDRLRTALADSGGRVVLCPSDPAPGVVARLAELGLEAVWFPTGARPVPGGVLDGLRAAAERLRRALR